MNKTDKIYVAGHNGLVGSAIIRGLQKKGYTNLITMSHIQLDLTNQAAVEQFFAEEKPDYVFLAAAKVGGINANLTYPAEFIYINMMIEANVIHASYLHGVKKLMFLGSGCIYPRVVPQPIKEEYLLTAALEKTNEAYAVAKIAGLKLCEFYNQQYGTDFISVMPCNLYGEGDNYNLSTSHVVPALLRKFYEAKLNGDKTVPMWGTGVAMREFIHVDDMADATIYLMEKDCKITVVNVGCGEDISILELATIIKDVTGFEGKIVYDPSMPDGTPRKLLDSQKLFNLGWRPSISLREGLERTYADYLENKSKYQE